MKSLIRIAGLLSLGGLAACETELAELTHLTGADNQAELVRSLVELDSATTNVSACISLPTGRTATAEWTITRAGGAETPYQTAADVGRSAEAEVGMSREGHQWHCHLSGDLGASPGDDVEVKWTFDVAERELVLTTIAPYSAPETDSSGPSFGPLMNAALQEVQPGETNQAGNWAFVGKLAEEDILSTRYGPLQVFTVQGKTLLVPDDPAGENVVYEYAGGVLVPHPVTLTRGDADVTLAIYEVLASDERLIAFGETSVDSEVWYSTDGVTWSETSGVPDFWDFVWAEGNDEFVAVDENILYRLPAASSAWTSEVFAPDAELQYVVESSLENDAGVKLVAAEQQSVYSVELWRRADGGAWARVLASADPTGSPWSSIQLNYLQSAFYALVSSPGLDDSGAHYELYRSTDGLAWASVLATESAHIELSGLVEVGDRLALVTGDGVYTSADGQTWSDGTLQGAITGTGLSTGAELQAVGTYDGHTFVQVMLVPSIDVAEPGDVAMVPVVLHSVDGVTFCPMPAQFGSELPGYTLVATADGVYQLGSDRNGTVAWALDTDGLECGGSAPVSAGGAKRHSSGGGSAGLGVLMLMLVLGRRRLS